MADFREDATVVAAHVARLAVRSADEADMYADSLYVRCWPGGCTDRHDPIAIEWLRRWTPATVTSTRISCSCSSHGRCALCN